MRRRASACAARLLTRTTSVATGHASRLPGLASRARGRRLARIARTDPRMPRFAALLRRHRTLLFLVCISLLAAAAVVQTVRLRYLEERHARMFNEFGQAEMEFRFQAGALQRKLNACEAAAR